MFKRIHYQWLLVAISAGFCATTFGAGNNFLENVLVSRTGNTVTVGIRFACPARYIDHQPLAETDRLRISLSLLDHCGAEVFRSPAREIIVPTGGALAGIREVEYVARTGVEAILLIRFDHQVHLSVQQRGDLRSLRLLIDSPVVRDVPDQGTVSSGRPAIPPVALPLQQTSNPIDRSPETLQRAEAAVAARMNRKSVPPDSPVLFAINLQSTTEPVSLQSVSGIGSMQDRSLYLTEINISGRTWYRLRLGFFPTEAAAQAAENILGHQFPSAWIVKVSKEEKKRAVDQLTDSQDLEQVVAIEPAVPVFASTAPGESTNTQPEFRVLSEARVSELMAEAKTELQKNNFNRAIQLYTKILSAPNHSFSADAREYLGLTRERNNQIAHAVAEYRRYLDSYPTDPGANRVNQRLTGLLTARDAPKESRRNQGSRNQQNPWDIYGGISQYYRRDVFSTNTTGTVIGQSSLLTDADIIARRHGKRFDFSTRATMGYLYDLLSKDEGPGNNSRLYNAYIDLQDNELDLFTRLGRQSQHTSGVLGRFDGLHIAYDLKPDMRINVTAGYPVDSSADSVHTERFFYGTGVEFLQVMELFDFSVFYNIQEVGSIENREAVGAEVRYSDGSKSFISTIDYDIGFNTVNSFVALGNWTFENQMTLSATVDLRKSPYLTTRAALIGQQVANIEDLLLIFPEDEIRQLAEDRAADVQTYSFGVSTPVFERFHFNLDVSLSQFGGTPASGGVPELPDFGTQVYYSTNLIGYSLLREGDTSILGLHYIDSDTSTTSTFSIDSRYPLSRELRINPRIIISLRESALNDSGRRLVRPSLRILYRPGRHYQLDFEIGGEWSSTDSVGQTTDISSYFIYLGYHANF